VGLFDFVKGCHCMTCAHFSRVDTVVAEPLIGNRAVLVTQQSVALYVFLVEIHLHFNVKRYRLLGYENRAIADERFRDDSVDAGEVGAGHTVTAIYEIEQQENPSGRLGTVHIRYKDPESGKTTEVKQDLGVSDISDDFYKSSENFRLAALAAELAEVLRGSPYAKHSKLSALYGLARKLALDFDNRKDIVEFVSLIAAAARIKGEEINEESDGGSSDETGVRTGYNPPAGGLYNSNAAQREETRLDQVLPLFLIALGITVSRVAYFHGIRRRRSRRSRIS